MSRSNHNTYIVCLDCREGRQLAEIDRRGRRTALDAYDLTEFLELHLWVGHDVRALPGEAARAYGVICETWQPVNPSEPARL